ncbi:MAG: hypothetical protein ACTHLW_18110 [Verrucomicrobiota bacterium]
MKAIFLEHEQCFTIEFEAENMQEAALLVRFGMNRTKEIRHASATVTKDGRFDAAIVFGKSKRANNYVPTT